MIRLNDVLSEWKTDCVIDKILLDESSLTTPNLHAKYLEVLMKAKTQLRHLNQKRRDFPATERRDNSDFKKIEELRDETQDTIDALEEILKGINQRTYTIRSIIEWRRFTQAADI